jgi:hypothetical protein
MKKLACRVTLTLLLLFVVSASIAQDLDYVRRTIDSLASERLQGRGYVNNGEQLAAEFLVRQLKELGVLPFEENYFRGYYQYYKQDINSFPGAMSLSFDEQYLKPGTDFVIGSTTPSIKGSYKVLRLDQNSLKTDEQIKAFQDMKVSNKVILIDTGFKETDLDKIYMGKAVIFATPQLPAFDVSEGKVVTPFGVFFVPREKIPATIKKVKIEVESTFLEDHESRNVIAYIPGQIYPDSFIVFTAHYDHLGHMGAETYFPGAHDNASGCAMLLDLARYFSQEENQFPCSIAFIFFSGEEAGLLGSKYYSENPVFPLKKIRFLINLDMVSSGSDGIKVVNGSVLKKEMESLVQINQEDNLLKTVSPRGEAANSDHHWFTKKGVPSFFIYTLGNEWKEYHNVKDVAKGLPMTEYEDLFKLVTRFVDGLVKAPEKGN